MYRIRRVGVISAANVSAAITFVIALFFVLILLLVLLPQGNTGGLGRLGMPDGGSILVLLLVPFLYAIFGWISGALTALVYNLVASFTGGLRLDVERRSTPVQEAWTAPGAPPPAPPPASPPYAGGPPAVGG